jgi:hypothetical protein
VAVVTVGAILIRTSAFKNVYQAGIDNGGLLERPVSSIRFHSHAPPLEAYAPPDARDERLFMRYLAECLDEDDRIWDTSVWFPIAYYARRPLVDHPYWSLGFRNGITHQKAVLESLDRHPAPLVIMRYAVQPSEAFRDYPLVEEYVVRHYRPITSATFAAFAEPLRLHILGDDRRPATGRFAPLDLPCFRQVRKAAPRSENDTGR